jgi:ATP-dependent Clp protease ATP-binding subunit ClpC
MDQVSQSETAVAPTPTPRFESTVARATERAQDMGHTYVGTEHLLLALLDDQEGIAGQVLHSLQIGESIRQAIETILVDPEYRTPTRQIYLGRRRVESTTERGEP